MKNLPETEKVFFVHYQCQNFEEGTAIHSLQIYAHGKVKEFRGKDEAVFIQRYCEQVQQLYNKGLIAVHWSQNRPYFGPDHINDRYEELTGTRQEFDYLQSINLSDWLKEQYGDDYIGSEYSNRLDRLSELNGFHGHSGKENTLSRTYPTNRLLLIHSIYTRVLKNTLVVDNSQSRTMDKMPTKSPCAKAFTDYLLHPDKEELAEALKTAFLTEKGKQIRILIEAMIAHQPPLLSLCKGERKAFYESMKTYFGRNIGAYTSIFDYSYSSTRDKTDLLMLTNKLDFILEKLPNSYSQTA